MCRLYVITTCTYNVQDNISMHAGSPLQKNAPIFGNVFTVTSHIVYVNAEYVYSITPATINTLLMEAYYNILRNNPSALYFRIYI